MTRKLLLSCALALAASPALADLITLTANGDGGPVEFTTSSSTGILNATGAIPGGIFTLNSVTATSQAVLPAPGLLDTNTLNLQQTATGSHSLVIDITASGLTGAPGLDAFLSSFSVSGLTAGWNAEEQTFIDGGLLADTGVFTTPSASAFSINNHVLASSPFSAEVRYTINSNGIGGFNGGIDISAVPGPIAGAGIPGLISACFGLWAMAKRRRSRNLA